MTLEIGTIIIGIPCIDGVVFFVARARHQEHQHCIKMRIDNFINYINHQYGV